MAKPPGAGFEITMPFKFVVPDVSVRQAYVKQLLAQKYTLYPDMETNQILTDMFALIDQYFTGGTFSAYARGSTINFEFSENMTSSGGNCSFRNCIHNLKIASKIMRGITPETVQRQTLQANGIPVHDRLDALLVVFEHELVHLMISISGFPDTSSHGPLFKALALNLFGQTTATHGLIVTPQAEIPRSGSSTPTRPPGSVSPSELQVGQTIRYKGKNGIVTGIIMKLNPKRARIRSNEGDFDVPYSILLR
jgi:hypothetical protein